MKRIVCCTDGTWDKPDQVDDQGKNIDSNVCKIFNAIKDKSSTGISQVKAYDTGVGTGYSLKDKILGSITGEGLDLRIKDMYGFIMMNYEPGDEIWLFGFSRGAYTARSLAGMIRNCGVLKPTHMDLLPKAFDLYRNRNDYTKPDSDMMQAFRREYAQEELTFIHFVGVWDTVGSLGIPAPAFKMYNLEKYAFHDTTLSSSIKNAFHALAIDERRSLFTPTMWEPSANTLTKGDQVLEQRWFSGVHCDVGGGYGDHAAADVALRWMVDMAKSKGMEFERSKVPVPVNNPLPALHDSFTALYWIGYPLCAKIWRKIDLDSSHLECLDDSVNKRRSQDPKYKPQNLSELPRRAHS